MSASPEVFLAGEEGRALVLGAAEVPLLQRFFERNAGYFIAVNGEPAGSGEASEEVHGELPAGWPFTRKWVVGIVGADGELVAMVNVVSDLLTRGVWHIGLFMVASERWGQGAGQALLRRLEAWARAGGATWLRLGVVEGNARAERFWEHAGFVDARRREGIAMGRRVNTVRVMAKPLAGGELRDYLALVPRDEPSAP